MANYFDQYSKPTAVAQGSLAQVLDRERARRIQENPFMRSAAIIQGIQPGFQDPKKAMFAQLGQTLASSILGQMGNRQVDKGMQQLNMRAGLMKSDPGMLLSDDVLGGYAAQQLEQRQIAEEEAALKRELEMAKIREKERQKAAFAPPKLIDIKSGKGGQQFWQKGGKLVEAGEPYERSGQKININNPGERLAAFNPMVLPIDGKEPDNKQRAKVGELMSDITPVVNKIDKAVAIYESGIEETDFTGKEVQKLAQTLTEIKSAMITLEKRGANFTKNEERIIDNSISAVSGGEGIDKFTTAHFRKMVGRDPKAALRNLREALQEKAEIIAYANSQVLNFEDPEVQAYFPGGSLLRSKRKKPKVSSVRQDKISEIESLKAQIEAEKKRRGL